MQREGGERAAEGVRERHSGNISKLDLAGFYTYLTAHRLDSINACGESKTGGV